MSRVAVRTLLLTFLLSLWSFGSPTPHAPRPTSAGALTSDFELRTLDLDVGVPPGSPLEWDKVLRQPAPTGHRGRVPTGDHKPQQPDAQGSTRVEEKKPAPKPPNMDYGSVNLYNYFRVVTKDIMAHVAMQIPKSTGKVTSEEHDLATGGGGKIVVSWNYPPEMPVELCWMAAMACIRTDTHPEIVSELEALVHCVELGACGYVGARAYGGKIGSKVQKMTMAVPPQPPPIPPGKGAYQQAINRLAVVELTSGYPYALDPTYCRRLLGLGNDAFDSVLACAKSAHPFLAENATAVLGNFKIPEASKELIRLFETTRSHVVRFRALSGLVRRREAGAVDSLISAVRGNDDLLRVYGLYALGMIGDPKGVPIIQKLLRAVGLKEPDILWTGLPALARLKDKSKETIETLKEIEKVLSAEIGHNDDVQQDAQGFEPPGSKKKVLRQMACLALAGNNVAPYTDEALRRGVAGFHPACAYLAVDVLVGLGDKGVEEVKKLTGDDAMKCYALRALHMHGKISGDELQGHTADGPPIVRAMAIQLLADCDMDKAIQVCRSHVSDYAGGSGPLAGPEAFVVAVAAQTGGKIGAWANGALEEDLIKAAQRAFEAKAWTKREGKNEPDITKCQISIYPALAETLILEAGRTGRDKARDPLLGILKGAEPHGRPEAALALGNVGGEEAVKALLDVMSDDSDGWTRFCAYLSVKHITSQDFFTDWIFGPEGNRASMVRKYRKWIEANPLGDK
ncbi:MAG: HEAT repeat domain-containing protein [Planctomycetes bacterium]|nr:HEAT repeat domain-containing protein [Planctomycetota bacterium]